MSLKIFRYFPALFTPFREDGSIDEKATEQLIEMNLRRGVKGFYVGGSSAEAFLMTVEERMRASALLRHSWRPRDNGCPNRRRIRGQSAAARLVCLELWGCGVGGNVPFTTNSHLKISKAIIATLPKRPACR